ncbi:unnamed protein product [Enterobius vermicularis]|uniref:TAXi_C domain-containing protein n=1 Tax=Enterobius vermicularis TaxID=51028 RepID=A0A0N4VAV8_ENTVE|nr:unnamed protein product [Enterobius vermicularis]
MNKNRINFEKPYPGRDASSLSPIFPFTSQFNNGLDVNPGTRVTVDGNLNVPIMGWGIWDYKGGVKVGRPNTRVGFGTLVRPTNVLGISPETIAILGSNGLFNEARRKLPSIPVSVLPGNFVPLRCKPPFCNPFLHNLAFGIDVEPGDDILFDGELTLFLYSSSSSSPKFHHGQVHSQRPLSFLPLLS